MKIYSILKKSKTKIEYIRDGLLAEVFTIFKNEKSYADMQRKFYEKESGKMRIHDHAQHDNNPNLFLLGYGPIINRKDKFFGSRALDFACGTGRNMRNIYDLKIFNQIEGCDISLNNINAAEENLKTTCPNGNFFFFTNDGISVPQNREKYKFIFSTIAFQHIPVRKIRNNLFKDLCTLLEDDGLFSFQMAFRIKGTKSKKGSVSYFRNLTGALGTNGRRDARVEDPENLVYDLKNAGFKYINYFITNSWQDHHLHWIWVHASKRPLDGIYLYS